jgi:hypothetical protein
MSTPGILVAPAQLSCLWRAQDTSKAELWPPTRQTGQCGLRPRTICVNRRTGLGLSHYMLPEKSRGLLFSVGCPEYPRALDGSGNNLAWNS